MRTSADRYSKFSATKLQVCPRCGSRKVDTRPKWAGNNIDGYSTFGYGARCGSCEFGYDSGMFTPNAHNTEKQAVFTWNVVCSVYNERKAARGDEQIDVSDLLTEEYKREYENLGR